MKLSKGFKTLKKCMAFLMVLTLLITVPTFEGKDAVAAPTDVVEIPDADLKAAINKALDVEDTTADITVAQMESLTSLQAGTISDLTGIEYCTNLTYLSFSEKTGEVVDITPIANLTKLEKLYLGDTADLSPIANLTNLKILSMYSNRSVTDYSALSNLVSLEELNLSYTDIEVLPDLSACTNLRRFTAERANSDGLSDISGLANCNNLEYVDIYYNYNLEDITPLKGKTKIKTLRMQGVGITEEHAEGYMETIASLTALESLDMPYTDIQNEHTSMFDPLTNLKSLTIGITDVTDLTFLLKHKDTLEAVTVHGNGAVDDGVLEQMTKLKILGIDGACIYDFSFISKMPDLTNDSMRFAEWGGSFPTSVHAPRIEENVLVTDGSYTFTNMFKDENGNPIVPNESDEYTYNAETNEITVPLKTTTKRTDVRVVYEFDMYTVSGDKLEANASHWVYLTPVKELKILTQPEDTSVVEEESLDLYVTVTGNYPYSYQWYKDGVAIEGEIYSSLGKNAAQQSDEGEYYVVITDKYGSITSETVKVDVTVRKLEASISSVIKVLEGNDFSIGASASGTGELSYQWYKDGNKLVGETSYLLKIEDAELSQSGEYYVSVTDKYDTVTSNSCQVTVIPNELTLTHPKSADLTVGDSTTLSVSVAEEDVYTYQWYKDGEKISGATASKLELKDVELEDAGDYYVIVKGTYAGATSNVAKITVEEETTATTEEETTATTEEETTTATEEETTTATEEETTTSTEDETTAATTEKVDEEPVTGDVSTFGLVALLVLMALAGVTSFKLRNKI